MIEKLKPCPCGKTPYGLDIAEDDRGGWAHASAKNCCGAWEIEFKKDRLPENSTECYKLAVEAWNEAPRANKRLTDE
ncbi:MAG: hypothetical protein ACC707_18840 [Thiohalomonadales bacterium]